MVYLIKNNSLAEVKVLVSVPKKNFKKAVDRNTLKRRMREAYRINNQLNSNNRELHLAYIYVYKDILDYKEIEIAIKALTKQLNELIN